MAVLVSLFACLFFSQPLLSEPMPENPSSLSYNGNNQSQAAPAKYAVKLGDTLWALAGAKTGDPMQWGRIYAANPFLQEEGRMSQKSDGTIVVVLKPGETLDGLDELGITPTLVPFSELTRPEPRPIQPDLPVEKEEVSYFPWWLVVLAVVLFAVGIVAWVLIQLRRNPIAAGRPIVSGGVTPENFETSAAGAAARVTNYRSPGGAVRANHLTVAGRRIGRLHGVTESFFEGMTHPRITRYNGEVGYQFDVRFPDRHVEQFHMAEACGNPIHSGLLSRVVSREGFTFTPMTAEEEAEYYRGRGLAPVSAPVSQLEVRQEEVSDPPVALVSAPASEAVSAASAVEVLTAQAIPAPALQEAVDEDGVIEVKFNAANDSHDSHLLEVTGVEISSLNFRQKGSTTTFRFRPVSVS